MADARQSLSAYDINVGDRGIKSAGVGVGDRTAANLQISRAPAREKDHELLMRRIPKTRSVGGQDNNRALGAVANQPA
jgi:hypothetical protein